jgi:signal transduction histidine kinase
MNRLQIRLMGSFFIVLMVTLCIIGVALLVFLRSRPAPTESLVNDLAAASLETDFRSLLPQVRPLFNANPSRQDLDPVIEYLETLKASTAYRLLLLDGRRVVYDSAGIYSEGTDLPVTEARPLRPQLVATESPAFGTGIFQDETGQEWVYVNRRLVGTIIGQRDQPPPRAVEYVVASPRPKQTLRRVIDNFGETFFIPLCQAGLIGLVIAFGLSIWLARSVAKPLQHIATAAGRVADGDYSQRVPITGPTEAQIVARAFNDMTAQVQQTQQAEQDFIANVTHDLRTPLTSIQGFSQAIMDGVAAEPEAARHAASIIYEEASRLTRLVGELLDITKIRAGRLQMMRHAVEIEQVLQRVGTNMQIKAEQKGVQLHQQIPPLVRIAGDGDRLAQVFTNLVDNAIKHTDAGGQVWLMAKLEGNGVLVQVQDTGEGIPEDDLSRIFQRFYQVDKSRNRDAQHKGAGLGLAITYEIIEAHQGRIWVESQVGVGSRFSVWLPTLTTDRSTIIQRRR